MDRSAVRGMGLSVEELRGEHDFGRYLLLLRKFAQRYCVIVAAMDTPCGVAFTPELSGRLMDVGFSVDLCGLYRMGYAAVVNAGELVYEEISPEPVEKTFELDGHRIELLSVGFEMERANGARLAVDGKASRSVYRGLNFLVCDLVTGTVLDDVNFDTYAPSFPCKRVSEEDDRVRDFLKKNPGVSLCCFGVLPFPTENLTENERYIREHATSRADVIRDLHTRSSALEMYYEKQDLPEMFRVPESYHGADGARRFRDVHGKNLNIAGGHRITTDQPEGRRGRTIFIVGGCRVFGIGVSDPHTIASELQRMVNRQFPNQNITVQNYGFFLAELDSQSGEELAILQSLPVKPSDIVLYLSGALERTVFLDTSNNSGRHGEEIFYDQMHFTPDGNRLMAEGLLREMIGHGILTADPGTGSPSYGFDRETADELSEYKRILTEYYDEMFGITIGCAVMNCNPFTNGHRYLIEEALKQCDYLVVFVVQEDQSAFSFDDRLKMVDEGTEDLPNVVVVPSGRFIISSLTFSEYFNKSELQERTVDPSLDVDVFAREIAPCLHITKRFAGEEPFDAVTRQYNETMRRALPEHGIEFVEIPRKTEGGSAVSASRVREMLKEKDLDGIRALVPETTYEFLVSWSDTEG